MKTALEVASSATALVLGFVLSVGLAPVAAGGQDQANSQSQNQSQTQTQNQNLSPKNDVNEIGNRKVAHKSIISTEKEIAMGKQYATEIDHSAKIITDPVVN
ncbi:MAG TPA: hypothetical protein VMG63_10655, partial [Terriglobia bacterium]|nr:hypothetical protein [Terriglobia bacterium]